MRNNMMTDRTQILKFAALACAGLLLGGCMGGQRHPSPPRMTGKIVGNIYQSPKGRFSVPVPVSKEVNGRVIHDDAESVLFQDNWGSRIAFRSGAIFTPSPMQAMLQKEGKEKALTAYLTQGYSSIVALHFHPEMLEGTMSFIYVKPVGPKTGVAAMIHDKRIYLVETDLLPGVQLLSKSDDASEAERDVWLENRAVELLRSMQIR
jgi:hypothetical protein